MRRLFLSVTLVAFVHVVAFAFVPFVSFVPSTPEGVRFHHLHFRVGDPAAAMNETAAKLDGTRVVVSGLGVGVRVGDEFVLYDRLEEGDSTAAAQTNIGDAYAAAVAWLKAKGIAAAPETLASSRIAQTPPASFHHLAFATADYDATVSRLAAEPVKRTSESMLFNAGGGLLVEIVRDNDLPDAFWCPMHPDVRSGKHGECPLCRMSFVPIPPLKVGEYRMDVTPKRAAGGLKGLQLAIREPDSNAIVRTFTTVHEKILHLFIVSRDLEYFAHVHPEQRNDGSFQLDHALSPGEYMLIADFLPANATAQTIQRAIIVPGRAAEQLSPLDDGGLRVWIKGENIIAGKEGRLTFTVSDPRTGAPVTDLEPYLGAPAHMLIVRSDLGDALHEHPEEPVAAGPTISFHPLIPAAGEYKLWLQVQRRGRVLTFPFELRVVQ